MWTSTKSRFDFELIRELRKNGTKWAARAVPEGGRERRSTGFGRRAIHASKTAAQVHKVLPMIVPSVMPPITAAPVGVRVISVSAGPPVIPRSVISRPYGNDYAGRFSRFRADEHHCEQC